MTTPELLALGLFTVGYLAITFEHRLRIPKHFLALSLFGVLWIAGSVTKAILDPAEEFAHHGVDVLGIVFFLWFAMSLVEVLVHLGFFDLIAWILGKLPLGKRGLTIVFWIATFFISAVLDNLTTALVMSKIALLLFHNHRNRIIVIGGIVIAANAGGAWSPIGDVTTVMLWIAEKFTTGQLIATVFWPAVINMLVAGIVLLWKGFEEEPESKETTRVHITKGGVIAIPLTLASFALPLVVTQFQLPPAFGLAVGLGLVGSFIHLFGIQLHSRDDSPMEMSLSEVMKKVEPDALFFFFGILFAVGALGSMGLLDAASLALLGTNPDTARIEFVNLIIGFASSVLDNIPLVAASMDIVKTTDYYLWAQLAYTSGTGGSILVIGSAAGVVAMTVYHGLNSAEYFKRISLAALLGYIAGYITLVVMY